MEALFLILKDEEVNKFLPWYPMKNLDDTRQFYEERYASKYAQPQGYAYAICLKEDNFPIGYILSLLIIAINVIGVICLIYFAVPYFAHSVTIADPNAMLPAEARDSAGMVLTFGFIPLLIANVLSFIFIKAKQKLVRLLFFIPSVICFMIVVCYWTT